MAVDPTPSDSRAARVIAIPKADVVEFASNLTGFADLFDIVRQDGLASAQAIIEDSTSQSVRRGAIRTLAAEIEAIGFWFKQFASRGSTMLKVELAAKEAACVTDGAEVFHV